MHMVYESIVLAYLIIYAALFAGFENKIMSEGNSRVMACGLVDIFLVRFREPTRRISYTVCPSADVDECQSNNGGCHSKRTCTNTAGGRTCGDCASGWTNDGDTGCALPSTGSVPGADDVATTKGVVAVLFY
jgi:hypothetical protein